MKRLPIFLILLIANHCQPSNQLLPLVIYKDFKVCDDHNNLNKIIDLENFNCNLDTSTIFSKNNSNNNNSFSDNI